MRSVFAFALFLSSLMPAFSHTVSREEVKERIGLSEYERKYMSYTPSAVVRECTEFSGYSVTSMSLNTEPDFSLNVNVFRPKDVEGRVPLVIVLEDREDISLQSVRQGYMTVSMPVRDLCGTVWDISKVIDYSFKELPVDRTNTICIGSQHAGVSTIYAGALDTRISISVPVSSFCPSPQEDIVSVAGLTAPRLFHVISGKDDVDIPVQAVKDGIRKLKRIYTAAGNVDGCRAFIGEEGRRFYGNGVWRFVKWRLLPEKESVLERTSSSWGKGFTASMDGKPLSIVRGGGFSYSFIDAASAVKIRLEGLPDVYDVDVSPHSSDVKVKAKKGCVTLKIPGKGYYIVNGSDGEKLFLFIEDMEPTPEGVNVLDCTGVVADGRTNITSALQSAIDANVGKTLVFPKGIYLTSGVRVPSDSHIFLEDGAVIRADRDSVIYDIRNTRAFVEIKDAANVSIRGCGVIDGDGPAVKRGARNRRNVLIVNSSDVEMEGIISLNPASWNTHILGSRNVTLKHYKVLNDMLVWNTDGIDPDCSDNVLIEDCFAHCGDDCIAVKTTDRLGEPRNLKGLTVRGCLFMTNKAGLKIGTETLGAEMSDIVFEDNVVVEALKPICLRVEDGTRLHDVIYRNNRFERCYSGPSAYDLYDTPGFKQECLPYHFFVRKRKKDSKLGSIYDVLLEGNVYEQPFPTEPLVQNPSKARIEFEIKQ